MAANGVWEPLTSRRRMTGCGQLRAVAGIMRLRNPGQGPREHFSRESEMRILASSHRSSDNVCNLKQTKQSVNAILALVWFARTGSRLLFWGMPGFGTGSALFVGRKLSFKPLFRGGRTLPWKRCREPRANAREWGSLATHTYRGRPSAAAPGNSAGFTRRARDDSESSCLFPRTVSGDGGWLAGYPDPRHRCNE